MELPQHIEDLLKKGLSNQRFAYDYSGAWRFMAFTGEEHKTLLEHFHMEAPKPELPKRPERKKYNPKEAKTFVKRPKDDDRDF